MGLIINKYESCDEAIQEAALKLISALDHPVKTLLLLSGGSSLSVAKVALSKLELDQKKLITIAQIDERYGELGHDDSNWNGIVEVAGSFNDYADTLKVLQDSGSIEEDAANYNAQLTMLFKKNILKVGLFGVGVDGHVAGMLPGSEAKFLKYTDGRMVVNFRGSDFPRITTTSALMKVLDEAVVYACGEAKADAINKLYKKLPANEHPAQLLKEVTQVSVYFGEGK